MRHETDEITWVAEQYPPVATPSGEATDRARQTLMREIAAEAKRPRARLTPRLSGALAAGVFAAAAAVVALTTSHGGASRVLAPTPRQHATLAASATPATTGEAKLVSLARSVAASPVLAGNATLVVHTNSIPGHGTFSGEDLYEDDGDYFYGADDADLKQALTDTANADPTQGKVIHAAAQSSDLTPEQAAANLYAASPVPTPTADSRAAAAQQLKAAIQASTSPTMRSALRQKLSGLQGAPKSITQSQRDNYLWLNISTALEGGAGRADVRAGALLAASTLPDVKVLDTTFDGQPVVQVTNTEFSNDYAETYDIDPQTGVVVHFRGGTVGGADSVTVTYKVTRVNAPDLAPVDAKAANERT